jgi:hypothetical protein
MVGPLKLRLAQTDNMGTASRVTPVVRDKLAEQQITIEIEIADRLPALGGPGDARNCILNIY